VVNFGKMVMEIRGIPAFAVAYKTAALVFFAAWSNICIISMFYCAFFATFAPDYKRKLKQGF